MTDQKNHIPILDLSPEIEEMQEDLDKAYRKVLSHGRFILGPEVEELEQAIARYLNVKYAIGVNSGTDALLIALRASGVEEGDEVITTSFTFFATAESIVMAGASPVFVDVQEEDFNMDPGLIEAAMTDKTKAIIPVHLFGKPADMTRIMGIAKKYGFKVIEDCAQSFGAQSHGAESMAHGGVNMKCGAIGDASALSFFPSKNLGGFGDGGMITTNDEDIAVLSRKLRTHGSVKKYHNEMMGYNSRLDTLQAALLGVKLPYIERFNQNRRRAARRYIEAFEPIEAVIAPKLPDDGHVYHQFTVRIPDGKRDKLSDFLGQKGISTMVYYPVPCHRLPVFQGQFDSLDLPVTERVKNEVLSLPIGPYLEEKDQDRVIEGVRGFFGI